MRYWLLFVALLLGCPGLVRAQSPVAADSGESASMLLRPGDLVRLQIWREKDLSGDLPVDEAGVVVFPKLGPLSVTGITPAALRVRLVDEYQRYLRNPSIQVMVLRRVTVLGSVRLAGVYPVDPTVTVADVVALAGGVTPDGRNDRVELRRGGEVVTTDLRMRTRISDSPVQSGDQLFVPERSWLSRNLPTVASFASVAGGLAVALLLR